MSGLFDDETLPTRLPRTPTTASKPAAASAVERNLFEGDQPAASLPVASASDVALFSDEARERLAAAKARAKAAAKEGAAQAVVAARATVSKATAEWIPAAKAKWASEWAKGVSKSVKRVGIVTAFVGVCASTALLWQSHVSTMMQTSTTTASVEPQAAVVVASTDSNTGATRVAVDPPTRAPGMVAPAPNPASTQSNAHEHAARPVADAAASGRAETQEDVRQPGHMKPVSFNPLSPAYKGRVAKPAQAKAGGAEKTAWEKEQDAKLEAWSQRGR